MSEEIAIKILTNVLLEVSKQSVQGGLNFLKWLFTRSKIKRDRSKIASRYYNELEKRYSYIKILGMNEPVRLLDLYVKVNVLKKISTSQLLSIAELEKLMENEIRGEVRFPKRIKTTLDGWEVANRYQKFIILGKPGSGKTTFLKYLLLRSISDEVKEKRIPVIISLRDFSDYLSTENNKLERVELFTNYIAKEFNLCGIPNASLFLSKLFEIGKCLLLLDGLDEVNDKNQNEVIRTIQEFSIKYRKNQFVISCRIAAYSYWFDNYKEIEIAEFDDNQIEQFIKNWFYNNQKIVLICLNELKENSRMRDLAKTPLLLTLLCISFEVNLSFPNNKVDLYKDALEVLLRRWDSERLIKRDDIYKNMSVSRKEDLFGYIAFKTHKNGHYFFKQEYVHELIREYLANLYYSKVDTLNDDSQNILKTIESQHGIIVERAKRIYSFSHLSFHEFYTANYIVKNLSEKEFNTLFADDLQNDSWREIIIMLLNLLSCSDILILTILTKIENMLKNKFLLSFLNRTYDIILQKFTSPKVKVIALMTVIYGIEQIQKKVYYDSYDRSIINENIRLLKIGITRIATHYQLSYVQKDKFEEMQREYLDLDLIDNKVNELSSNLISIHYQESENLKMKYQLEGKFSSKIKLYTKSYSSESSRVNISNFKVLQDYLKINELLLICLETESYITNKTREKATYSFLVA
jgi:predicted NACHT family NTPase